MTTTSIDRACPAPDAGTETELRAAARRRGLTMKELAVKMGVSALATCRGFRTGRTPWTPKMREKVAWRSWERSPARGSSTARAAS